MSRTRKPERRETVVLDRQMIENIVVLVMGWEHEDATVFWRNARRETRKPGCIEKEHRAYVARILKEAEASFE